jgi:hypothetical protein
MLGLFFRMAMKRVLSNVAQLRNRSSVKPPPEASIVKQESMKAVDAVAKSTWAKILSRLLQSPVRGVRKKTKTTQQYY